MRANRFGGEGMKREIESCCKAWCAKHAQTIFANACVRIADCADDLGVEIGATFDEIDDLTCVGALEDSVDGEVATMRIAYCIYEANGYRSAAILIVAVLAKCRDFNDMTCVTHEHDAEHFTDSARLWKEDAKLLGRCVGGDVVVARRDVKEMVAHATTCEKRFVTSPYKQGSEFARGRSQLKTRRVHRAPATHAVCSTTASA